MAEMNHLRSEAEIRLSKQSLLYSKSCLDYIIRPFWKGGLYSANKTKENSVIVVCSLSVCL